MADRIRTTQRHAKDRYINAGDKVDVLMPKRHMSVSDGIGGEWKFIGPTSTPVFGDTVEFEIPKNSYIGDLMVEFNLAAPSSGNYTTYPALSAIDRIQLFNQSGNELHAYHFDVVMQLCLSNLYADQRNAILQASGGTAFNSGRCTAPLPVFFGSFGHRGYPVPPIPAHMLQGKLRLEITLRSLADTLDVGASGGSISSMRVWYKHYNVDDVQRQRHFASRGSWVWNTTDWQTNRGNAITASTPTNFDISGFHGSISSLHVFAKSTANYTTANDYFLVDPIDDMRVLADGDQLYDIDSNNTQLLASYLDDGLTADGTLGEGTSVIFGYASPEQRSRHYTGSLHLNDVNQFELDQVDSSVTGQIDIVGEFDVCYKIDSSGNLSRVR